MYSYEYTRSVTQNEPKGRVSSDDILKTNQLRIYAVRKKQADTGGPPLVLHRYAAPLVLSPHPN